jgi:hypothetical protein
MGFLLDCFSGSGMTGVAAMMEDRPCLLIDTSPAAVFISHCYTHPVGRDRLQTAFDQMLADEYPGELKTKLRSITGVEIRNLSEELDWLYATRCDRCGAEATTEYVVYSERFQCPGCAQVVTLYDCPEVKVPYLVGSIKARKTELKKRRVCPHCLARRREPHRDFVISTRSQKFGAVPVLVRYHCLGTCRPATAERQHNEARRTKRAQFFNEHDLGKLRRIEQVQPPHWYPARRMMDAPPHQERWGEKWRRGAASFATVAELFDKRNLWALAAIRTACLRATTDLRDAFLFALTAILLNSSKMYRYRVSGKGGFQSGNYYIPQLSQIMRTSKQFGDKINDIKNGYAGMAGTHGMENIAVSEGNATDLSNIQSDSVDFVFTDPPYLNVEVQYGEMNFVWNAWLDLPARELDQEITISPIRNVNWPTAEARLKKSCSEIARVLKPGHYAAFCYHDTSESNWRLIQDALLDAGLEIQTVTALDPAQKSQKQLTKEKIVKSDLVMNCRKPRVISRGENGNSEIALVSRRVRDILIETLSRVGGQPRDRLWDTVLKRLLTRGQMAEHRFDDVLGEVAFKSESGRWFLKEEFESLSDDDVKNEEQAGAGLTAFARLRMAGAPAAMASEIVLHAPQLAGKNLDEDAVEKYIRQNLLKGRPDAAKFKLSGRMKGVEFYDCLFFYLTRWLKGRAAGKTPRRNLAEFLDEYLVRFKDGDKWLYRVPDEAEASALRKARQTGLGRRIRQYVAFLCGEGEFPDERKPDAKTLAIWLKHCANFGLPEEGVALFEKGGLAAQLAELQEELRYDAEDYYAQCRRRAGRSKAEEDDEEPEEADAGGEQ